MSNPLHFALGISMVLLLALLGSGADDSNEFDADKASTILMRQVNGALINRTVNRGELIVSCDVLNDIAKSEADLRLNDYSVQTLERTMYGTIKCVVQNDNNDLDVAYVEL